MAILNLGSDFTPSGAEGTVAVKTAEVATKVVETEKETPAESTPVEKPAEESVQDAGALELEKQLTGLQQEKAKLLDELKSLRGTRRELKEQQIVTVQKEMDDIKDVNPQDAELIERVIRSKGYVNKAEASKMYYESVKQQVIAEFLEKYPEYKPENDSQDLNWNSLNRELADYRMPENPHDIHRVLEKAHKAVNRSVGDRSLPAKQKAVQTASVGAGGTQRSSSGKSLDPAKRRAYEDGGWSEEEIKAIEKRL